MYLLTFHPVEWKPLAELISQNEKDMFRVVGKLKIKIHDACDPRGHHWVLCPGVHFTNMV